MTATTMKKKQTKFPGATSISVLALTVSHKQPLPPQESFQDL